MLKILYAFFLTACIASAAAVIVIYGKDLSATQQEILAGMIGALTMALQSTIHYLFQADPNPTTPGVPAGAKQ